MTRKQKQQQIHAFVATPAYDGRVLTNYAVSLAESCQMATAMGIRVTAGVMGNGAFIDLARNTFVKLFLEKEEYTHLFFIDADLNWEARAFVGLLQCPHDVSCGVYRRRQDVESYPVHWTPHAEGGMTVEGGWVLCDRVPTGFLCIRRHVVETMAAEAKRISVQYDEDKWHELPQLFYTYINEKGKFVGEDFAWTKDYVERFKKYVYCWPDFDFTHDKWKGNFHEYLNRKIEEEEAEDAATASVAA